MNKGMFTSNTGEWETPQDFFDELNQEFHFTLDPCATRENAKCKKFYTKEDDGLSKNWSKKGKGHCFNHKHEVVFMNPPYGREIGEWVKKARDESAKSCGAIVVALLPSRTDTRWFHNYCKHYEIRFIKGRLKFSGRDAAPFPSMVVIFSSL